MVTPASYSIKAYTQKLLTVKPKFGNDQPTSVEPFKNQAEMLERIAELSRPQKWKSIEEQVNSEVELAQKTVRFLETRPPLAAYSRSHAGTSTKYIEFKNGFYGHILIGYDPQRNIANIESLLKDSAPNGQQPLEEFIKQQIGNTQGLHPIMFIKSRTTSGTSTIFDAEESIKRAIESGDPNVAMNTAKNLIELSQDCKSIVDKTR